MYVVNIFVNIMLIQSPKGQFEVVFCDLMWDSQFSSWKKMTSSSAAPKMLRKRDEAGNKFIVVQHFRHVLETLEIFDNPMTYYPRRHAQMLSVEEDYHELWNHGLPASPSGRFGEGDLRRFLAWLSRGFHGVLAMNVPPETGGYNPSFSTPF